PIFDGVSRAAEVERLEADVAVGIAAGGGVYGGSARGGKPAHGGEPASGTHPEPERDIGGDAGGVGGRGEETGDMDAVAGDDGIGDAVYRIVWDGVGDH